MIKRLKVMRIKFSLGKKDGEKGIIMRSLRFMVTKNLDNSQKESDRVILKD
jgi:hypothetical protein